MSWTKSGTPGTVSYGTASIGTAPWNSTSSVQLGTQAARVKTIKGATGIDFTCMISSEFPFIIASTSNAVISSGISQGVLG